MATLKEMIEEREAAERAASENHGSTSQSAENKPKNVGGFGGGLEYLGSQFLNGLLQNVEGMTDFVSGGLADLFGNEEYAKKVFSEDWFNYDAATEKFNPGTAWKVAGDVASVIGGAVPDIAIGYGVGAIGAGLGTAGKVLSKGVQAATSFSSAGGRAMSEAVNTTGELGAKEWAGGAGAGGLAAGIELISGAVGSALGGGFGKTAVEMGSEISESSAKRMSKEAVGAVLSKATGKEAAEEAGESGVKKLINSIFKSKTGKEILGEFISEGAEESFETLIEPEIKQNTYNYDAPDATLNDVLYSFILGGGAGAGIRGGTLGISAAVNNVQNFTRGAKIYGSQSKLEALMHNAEVISNYESEKQTGSEVFEAVQATYEKVKQSLDSGKVLSKRQYGEIGQLERLVATSVLEPLTVKTAVDLARNKERTTEILNSYYKQKGIDKLIAPEELIAGLDTQHGDRAFVKSVRRALSDNSLLRDVVLNNMLGRLSFDAMNYANSIYDGTKISTIATQENINRFLAKADKATLAEVGAALGIRDWANLTPDELAKAIKAFRDSGRAELYRGGYEAAKRAASFSGDAVALPSADGRLQVLSALSDGVTRYRSDGMDIAVVKEGGKYRLYDYESGKITRQMTLHEMNELLSNIEERIADFKAESEMAALDREIDKFAEENIPEYKKLTEPEREAVRETIRRARANGASEADQVLFGRLAAKSGLKLMLTENIPGSEDGRSALATAEQFTDYDKPITIDDVNVLRSIGRKSINSFSVSDIEKSQKWAHKFYKELGVKSPFFRAWFGDWRAQDKSQRKIVSVPTIDVSQVELATGDYTVGDTGWTVYAGKTLNDDTRHHTGGKRINVKSLSAIEQILNNAVLLDTVVSEPDTNKKSPNTAFLHKLYTLIEYEGQTYIAKTSVEEFYNQGKNGVSRKAYNLKAIKIESAGGQFRIKNSSSSVPVTDSIYSISDLYDFVKTYDKDFTLAPEVNPQLLNDDGTPKVFYHGTNAEFNTFEKGHKRTRGRLNFGEGFYFAANKNYAENYIDDGGKVIDAYVSLKKPYTVIGNQFTEFEMEDIRSKLAEEDKSKLNYDNANEYLAKLGYDGVVGFNYSGASKTINTVVAFEPTQIKSATDNIGTFSKFNSDIRYALLGKDLRQVAKYDGKNTVYIDAKADRVDTFSALLGHEMFHKMFRSKRVKGLFMQVFNRLDADKKAEVKSDYRKFLTAQGKKNIGAELDEEVAAAYAQELFNSPDVWDFILEGEPSLSDRIIAFFGGVPKRYAFADGMDAAAKRWLNHYKKLFNEVAELNRGESARQNAVVVGKLAGEKDSKGKVDVVGRVKETDGGRYAFGVTQEDMNAYVDNAYENKNTQDYKKYATVSERLLNDVSAEIDISGYAHALRDNDIRHIRNSHGEGTNEKYPVTKEDLSKIPDIVLNYDKVFVKTNAQGKPGLVYIKVGEDNVVYYVEAITQQYHNEKLLVNKQMIKTGFEKIPNLYGLIQAINKKESSSQYLADLEKIRKAYVQDVKENYSTTSIPDSAPKSNSFDKNSSKNADSGGRSALARGKTADKATVKLKADLTTDTVFSQSSVEKIMRYAPALDSLPKGMKSSLAEEIFLDMNESLNEGDRAKLRMEYTVKIKEAILGNENGKYYGAGIIEQTKLRDEIDAMMRNIAEAGKASKRAKMAEEVRGEVKSEESKTRRVLAKIYSSLKRIDDTKRRRYAAASDYKGKELGGAIDALTRLDWRGELNHTIARKQIKVLSDWYSESNPMFKKQTDSPFEFNYFDPGIRYRLDKLTEIENGVLKLSDLEMLADVTEYFSKLIGEYDMAYVEGKWQSGEDLVYRFGEGVKAQKGVKLPFSLRILRNKVLSGDFRKYGDSLSVMKLADCYQDGIFTTFYNEWQNGIINSDATELRLKEEYDTFLKDNPKYLKEAGKKNVRLHGAEWTRLELIEYFMTLKRKQAWESIAEGGIVITKQTESKLFGKRKGADVHIYPISPIAKGQGYSKRLEAAILAEREQVEAMLSEKDLEYVKILEAGYLAAKEVKAEGDVKRLGFASVIDGYYYPIRHKYTEHLSEFWAETIANDRYSHAGFNKHMTEGAKSELSIGSADATFNRYVGGVTRYLHLSPVMDSFNKVYKLKVPDTKPATYQEWYDAMRTPGKSHSLQTLIAQSDSTWRDSKGVVGFTYLQNMMLDTMGSIKLEGDGFAGKLRSGYVGFALGANPKVLATQFSSLIASTSMISGKSHFKGAFSWRRGMDNYSIVARLRDSDYTIAKSEGVVDKVDGFSKFFTKGISLVDRFVVYRAWNACQAEVEATQGLKIGSEENLIAAGKLLDEVILNTQQNAFASRKTEGARRGNMLVKTILMFKSDAITVTGRVIDAWGERAYLAARLKQKDIDASEKTELKKQYKASDKKLSRAVGAVAMSAVYMVAVAEAFKHLYGKADDEEKIEDKIERLRAEFIGNLIGGAPIFSELHSYFTQGYDLSTMEFSAINDILATVSDVAEYAENLFDGTADERDGARMIEKVLYAIGQGFGVPFRNIKNITYGLTKMFNGELAYKWNSALYKQGYASDLNDAIEKGDVQMAATILELALGEKLGSGLSDAARDELVRLSSLGEKMIPSAISDTVTIDGEERTLTGKELSSVREKYAEAVDRINSFIDSELYESYSDEQKASAVRKIYSFYKDLAYDSVMGAERNPDMLILSELIDADVLCAWVSTGVLTSDKDENGKTIAGSKREKVVRAISSLDVSGDERLLLIALKGYSLADGDIRGVSAYAAKVRLYNYIAELEGLTDEERLELYEASGFEVKNGEAEYPRASTSSTSSTSSSGSKKGASLSGGGILSGKTKGILSGGGGLLSKGGGTLSSIAKNRVVKVGRLK